MKSASWIVIAVVVSVGLTLLPHLGAPVLHLTPRTIAGFMFDMVTNPILWVTWAVCWHQWRRSRADSAP